MAQLFGGLGLLLYGIRLLGAALGELAASRAPSLLIAVGRRPLAAFVTGTVITALLQSSSATTVMIASLTHGRLLTVPAAIAAIMGANVGTTVTSQALATWSRGLEGWLIGGGALLVLLGSPLGRVVFGFGLVLLGLTAIDAVTAAWAEDPMVTGWVASLRREPYLALLSGFLLTTILDSSSAAIALLQRLTRHGLVSLEAALPMLFGDNIGTTTATLLLSFALGPRARQVSLAHVLFNVVGTLLFWPMREELGELVRALSDDPARQLAHAHFLFNAVNAAVQLPFHRWHARVAAHVFPERGH